MRYHLLVHDVHKTHLDKLDATAKKYLKKWLNIPSHGASDIAIFHPYLLSVKSPSQLYKEGHAGNYSLMRIKGDKIVNQALDSRLERESNWINKSSTILQCHQILEQNIQNEMIISLSLHTLTVQMFNMQDDMKYKEQKKPSRNLQKRRF